jgi:hypothetical protein
MPALINYTIPKRSFEPIRDRIAEILFIELNNQYLRYNPECNVDGVYVERKKPIDQTELTFVNVSVISGAFDNKTQGSKDGTYQYAIDIFTRSASESNKPGDKESQLKLESLLSICDYILEDPQYKTLLFPPGFIGGILVGEMQIREQNAEDASNIAMGRLILTVRTGENNLLKYAPLLQQSFTISNLAYSDKGYQYIS